MVKRQFVRTTCGGKGQQTGEYLYLSPLRERPLGSRGGGRPAGQSDRARPATTKPRYCPGGGPPVLSDKEEKLAEEKDEG